MSKIICDICGTSYPETAKRCPICGCVCDSDVQRATSEISKEGNVTTGYTYVKGGRFSKANVKKRNKENAKAEVRAKTVKEPEYEKPVFEEPVVAEQAPEKSGRGLVITAVLLLVAIIAVLSYIAVKIFWPISDVQNQDESTGSSMNQSIPCTNVVVDTTTVVLEQAGEAVMLDVKREPANTTDTITFVSENEAVATVSSVGKITAVGNGTTKIVITCGDIIKEVEVTCQFAEDTSTEDTTEDTTEETTEDTTENETKDVLELNRKDITFKQKGNSWMLYSGTIAKNLITWSTDDETVATIEEGKVVAVGNGTTKVYAQYEDQKVSCVIRCKFEDSTGVTGNGGVSEDGGNSGTAGNGGVSEDGGNAGNTANVSYKIFTQFGDERYDITISKGSKCGLYMMDSNGKTVQANWSISGSAASLSGSTVTGVESGTSTVTATYNGVSLKCIVRVSK